MISRSDLLFSKGHAFIMINSKGENVIVIVGGANMHYDDLSKLPTEYQDAINNSIYKTLH